MSPLLAAHKLIAEYHLAPNVAQVTIRNEWQGDDLRHSLVVVTRERMELPDTFEGYPIERTVERRIVPDRTIVGRAKVNYRMGEVGRECRLCRYFEAPDACERVEGRIRAFGMCDLFEA